MRVFIKYNPNTLSTEITVNGKPVKPNSQLNVGNVKLADWINDLPEIIEDEYSTAEFELVFRGTVRDYALVAEVVERAEEDGFEISLNHILAKYDKEKENKKSAPKVNSFEDFAQNYSEDEELVPFVDDEEEQKQISSGKYDEDFEDNRRLPVSKQKAENDYESKFYSENPPSSNVKRVFIKYNPYVPYTHITVEGNNPKSNSGLNIGNLRLQEWIEKLPEILSDEYYARRYKIGFHGTDLDYEDVLEIANEANNIEVIHYPAKEVKDKENLIQHIFDEIQKGPFDELRDKNVVNAFNNAKNSDFEVDVVATMSSGKSTLINSLLSQKLMPAKQEACTATITRIKDNSSDRFTAKVYDKDGNNIRNCSNLTYKVMQELNSDEDVSKICVEGNIPFVTSDDISLVLVDTPGPNNSRDENHKKTTYKMLSESEKTLVLYIMNATQLAVNDDNVLLSAVADSMKVGGKQSRDRFIFVVNKLDDYKKGEDSVQSALNKVKGYLKEKGIENPNIYPASALTALDIRTTLAESDDEDDDEVYNAKGKVRKFNKNEEMHFENLAPLAPSAKRRVQNILQEAIDTENKNKQALVHCGIIPLEESIKMYVHKYAKPMKIRNIVDTFIGKLESCNSFEKAKSDIATNKAEREKILSTISKIKAKIENGKEAKKFKDRIENIDFSSDIEDSVNSVISEAQSEIRSQINQYQGKVSQSQARSIQEGLVIFTKNLQNKIAVKLENLVENQVKRNAEELLNQYKAKLADLSNDIDFGTISFDTLSIMSGTVSSINIDDITQTEKVTTSRQVKRSKTFWECFKFWDWGTDYYDTVYDTEYNSYVDMTALTQKFFTPIQENLWESANTTTDYTNRQIRTIKEYFIDKFEELDNILKDKLNELQKCATDQQNAEKMIRESEMRLDWLQDIQEKVNSIIEI